MARRFCFLILTVWLFPPGTTYAQGLSGEYFTGRQFTGTPVLTRTEAVNFNWAGNAPDPAMGADNFCVRWTGSITVPDTGNYIFSTRSDDGVRLLLSGEWVIDNWTDHSASVNDSSPMPLEAGKTYGMRLEFYENGGDAVVELYWTPPGGKREPIPADVLSTTYVRPLQARLPSPANGAADVVVPALTWKAGEDAKFHSVYIGTSPDLTAADLKSSRQYDAKFFYALAMMTPGVTYYWRVDEIEKDGLTTHVGQVWSFMMRDLTAYRPAPADGWNEVPSAPILTWLPGMDAETHQVFFSSSRDAVAQGAAEADKGKTQDANFVPGALDSLTTYYWRIDEILIDSTIRVGPVWSFTTCILIDGFESYTDDVGSRIFQAWIDGVGFTEPPPGNLGNGTGAAVGYPEPPFAELSAVHGGLQAMPMDYNNVNSPWYSETQREFVSTQDWKSNDVNDLVLYFRGRTANAPAPLYVVIEDASKHVATVVHTDPAAVNISKWTQWRVPLSRFTGVNLAAVKKMCIGVGDRNASKPGGAGKLFIDDIMVVKPVPAGQ